MIGDSARQKFLALGRQWQAEDQAAGTLTLDKALNVFGVLTEGARLVEGMVSIVGPERAVAYFRLVAESIDVVAAEHAAAPPSSSSAS